METNVNDLIGQKFGKLTIIDTIKTSNGCKVVCKCDCGNKIILPKYKVTLNNNKSCGCIGKSKSQMEGMRFGRLVVVKFIRIIANDRLWLCKCDCGKDKITRGKYLRRGGVSSCGCFQLESHTKHKMSKSRFYNIWSAMKTRSNGNINAKHYKKYAENNIQHCERWNDYNNFKDDMYEKYLEHCKLHSEKNTTIERINVLGDYNPENCRWATFQEQADNKTTSKRHIYNGQFYTLRELSDKYNVPYKVLRPRIVLHGFSMELALQYTKGKRIKRYFKKPK